MGCAPHPEYDPIISHTVEDVDCRREEIRRQTEKGRSLRRIEGNLDYIEMRFR
jgi:hypothetical protein